MIIHFSILAVILLVSAVYEHQFRANKIRVIAAGGTAADYLGSIWPWLIIFGYIAFLAGMRTNVNDTYAYKESFIQLEASWETIGDVFSGDIKDKGFTILAILFKMYISTDYHAWFFFIAIFESLLIINVLKRETVSLFDACMIFFFTTLYFNYFSMMRQWIAVSIVFWASRFIKKRKIIPYIFFCLLAAQFHNSAYLMIFFYFFATGKAWSKKQLCLIVSFALSLIFLQPILGTVGFLTEDTTYNYVVNTMQTSSGSSWIRIPIAAVPLVLAYFFRKRTNPDDNMINLTINMSLLNLLMLILASLTSGLFVGRMSNYIQIYSLILYPYLFNIILDEKSRTIIRLVCYILYFLFYLVQMNVSDSFFYGSDIIGYFH